MKKIDAVFMTSAHYLQQCTHQKHQIIKFDYTLT